MRQQLLDCLQKTLQSIDGQFCVQQALLDHPLKSRPCIVVAIGKAAQAMAQGAQQVLAENLISGLLITKQQHSDIAALSPQWQCYEAAHPVPDTSSLEAGQRLLAFLASHKDLPVLFLISGGTSSLVEVLPDDISLQQWQQLNEWLLASGLDIANINAIRKTVSKIKAGKLLKYLQGCEVHALLISDVPGDQLHIIGSGLLFAEPTESLAEINIELPQWIKQLMDQHRRHQVEAASQTGQLASQHIIATNHLALESAASFFRATGDTVFLHEDFLSGNAEQRGKKLAAYLLHKAEPGIHIWGGETTMVLPENSGRGGRNQHLALSAACELSGNEQITLLVAATDGTDGPTEDAGGIVDGGTLERGQLAGLDAVDCLARADSGRFLEAAGDLLYTGPTGTNVMDLLIAIKK